MFDLSEMDEDVLKALIDKDIDNSSAGGYKLNK
jgi:hypothetical protein